MLGHGDRPPTASERAADRVGRLSPPGVFGPILMGRSDLSIGGAVRLTGRNCRLASERGAAATARPPGAQSGAVVPSAPSCMVVPS